MNFVGLRDNISAKSLIPENEVVSDIIRQSRFFGDNFDRIYVEAEKLVLKIREDNSSSVLEAFLHEYGLETREGVVVMCLAEALLRIPDADTADRLIQDKLKYADFEKHIGGSDSLLVNASTWGLMLTGRVVGLAESEGGVSGIFNRMVSRTGEPVIRKSLRAAMKIIGGQFVLGENIKEALSNAGSNKKYLYSFDILGEAARTDGQALAYCAAYEDAIKKIAAASKEKDLFKRQGISIKLSALHPRYELLQKKRVMGELYPRLLRLMLLCAEHNVPVTLDAEEAFRLDISLEIFERLVFEPSLKNFEGAGLVVQAYQKRAVHVIGYLAELAKEARRRIPVRLVKGAYWDAEIKRAQMLGLTGYPVFTKKQHTDVSYLACAGRMLEEGSWFYPQFATHNSLTIASIIETAGDKKDFEFQRLHGMGESLYDQIISRYPCRVYAPVGKHEDLLAYLIRRLLENGANTSFVNLLIDKSKPVKELLVNPIRISDSESESPNRYIPLPKNIFRGDRQNSSGIDAGYAYQVEDTEAGIRKFLNAKRKVASIIGGKIISSSFKDASSPTDFGVHIAEVSGLEESQFAGLVDSAERGFAEWSAKSVETRTAILERAADELEKSIYEATALLMQEGGKTLYDAVAEVREAADFCRYYSKRARELCSTPKKLQGYTGESNTVYLHPRGIFAAISPWNFPLAIFTGQVIAALATGNSVIAKPAEQTPAIAAFMVSLLHRCGVPPDALNLAICSGRQFGDKVLTDARIAGVVFTGSTETAWRINQTLAARKAPIAVLIAETGGQNAMLVDSTALLEQAADDILLSAFGSAGQRCSALRVLYAQDEIADKLIELLKGAAAELRLGNPTDFSHDIGPVINAAARDELQKHIDKMKSNYKVAFTVPVEESLLTKGAYLTPHAFEIPSIKVLENEVFGPVLHIVRYRADSAEQVFHEINSTGFGLTLGVHSRIEGFAEEVRDKVRAGNVYVNRSMTGAVVGVHPFGGEGLSGTGPKAGGEFYLQRFLTEKTYTVNTAAIGGNLELLS